MSAPRSVSESTYLAAAAAAHVLAGVAAVLGAIVFGFPWWCGAVAVLVVATLKETLADPYDFEDNPFLNGTSLDAGWFDLAMYPVGIGAAVAVLSLTGHL